MKILPSWQHSTLREIPLYSCTFWGYSGQWCVPAQARWMFWQYQAINNHCRWHNDCLWQSRPQWSWPAFINLLQTSQKCNVKLNYDKLQYKHDEVEFLGETYTTSGCKPSKDEISAITAMPSPTNRKQVQSFIGMINYLSNFSPRLSELAEPIRELSQDKLPFNWGLEHQQAFTQMKNEISSLPVLTYYNPKKQTTLQTDSSVKGLGACLLQEDRPVYFASKALTDVQKGYVAIELELLAVAWAMEKFHHFLYASYFILETYQNLLEAISSKSLNQATPRLQQILIRTCAYHFIVRYIPGITNQLADCFPG